MKIQVIENSKKREIESEHEITYSSLNSPMSLDSYDINIISLQNSDIWKNEDTYPNKINIINDLKSIRVMLLNSKKAINIIAFPMNFKYYYDWNKRIQNYYYEKQLKDMIPSLTDNILSQIIPYGKFTNCLLYENSQTTCNNSTFDASFYFSVYDKEELTKSDKSEKITTIGISENIKCTTMHLDSPNCKLDDFLSAIGLKNKKEEIPEWVKEYEFFDDSKQKKEIDFNTEKIKLLQEEIESAKQCLENNMHYKSILFTNGNELVKVVFEILEKVLECDLSDFKDELKEDFLIKKENITFIGEIKGVTSNIKNEHISQVEVHYQSYADKLQEKGITETVKQLLVINPFRVKEIPHREEVHINQINLAKRNGCLIITTEMLLFVFERFLINEFSAEHIIRAFTDNEGILTKEMLNF